jgi:hypothetical protein
VSYSFATRGATKAEAKSNVSAELDKVVESQPVHAKDRDAHEAAAGAMIDLVRDPGENEAILVNVTGSCYGRGNYDDPDMELDGASLSINVSFAPA